MILNAVFHFNFIPYIWFYLPYFKQEQVKVHWFLFLIIEYLDWNHFYLGVVINQFKPATLGFSSPTLKTKLINFRIIASLSKVINSFTLI